MKATGSPDYGDSRISWWRPAMRGIPAPRPMARRIARAISMG